MIKFPPQRLERSPDQVLRYGGQPLRMTADSFTQVDNCPYCGGERKFELQILSTFLYKMAREAGIFSEDEATGSYKMDFGSVNVFTCANDCMVMKEVKECVEIPENGDGEKKSKSEKKKTKYGGKITVVKPAFPQEEYVVVEQAL